MRSVLVAMMILLSGPTVHTQAQMGATITYHGKVRDVLSAGRLTTPDNTPDAEFRVMLTEAHKVVRVVVAGENGAGEWDTAPGADIVGVTRSHDGILVNDNTKLGMTFDGVEMFLFINGQVLVPVGRTYSITLTLSDGNVIRKNITIPSSPTPLPGTVPVPPPPPPAPLAGPVFTAPRGDYANGKKPVAGYILIAAHDNVADDGQIATLDVLLVDPAGDVLFQQAANARAVFVELDTRNLPNRVYQFKVRTTLLNGQTFTSAPISINVVN